MAPLVLVYLRNRAGKRGAYSNAVEKPRKNLPFIILISIFIAVILSQLFSNEIRIKILNIFRVPMKLISGAGYLLRDVAQFNELREQNKILSENVENLEREVLKLREAGLENRRLRKLLGFIETQGREFIPAMVIARDLSGLRDAIIIDKGRKDGLVKDMAVISGNGLVGRVRECGWSIARVVLITDCDSAVSGIVQRTRDSGDVVGKKGSRLVMKYLELDSDVKAGDEVITSGFGGIFDKGILIGKVLSVEEDSSGLYLNAILKPEVEMGKLEEVLVIR